MGKKKVSFEAFLDGICSVWQLDAKRRPELLLSGVRYHNRVVGARRNFDAEQAGHTVEKLVRVPRCDRIARGNFVTIEGKQYRIVQVQTIQDTIPECTDLTLEASELVADFHQEEAGTSGRI